jgi:hypothetical protein
LPRVTRGSPESSSALVDSENAGAPAYGMAPSSLPFTCAARWGRPSAVSSKTHAQSALAGDVLRAAPGARLGCAHLFVLEVPIFQASIIHTVDLSIEKSCLRSGCSVSAFTRRGVDHREQDACYTQQRTRSRHAFRCKLIEQICAIENPRAYMRRFLMRECCQVAPCRGQRWVMLPVDTGQGLHSNATGIETPPHGLECRGAA